MYIGCGMYHDRKPRQTETLWAKYRAKKQTKSQHKKINRKEKKTKVERKKRCGVCTYSYNIYKWFNNGHYGSVHTFPALRV